MQPYRIEQRDGQWVLTNADDPELTWTGRCWANLDIWGHPPMVFSSKAEAEKYAQELWGKQITTHQPQRRST